MEREGTGGQGRGKQGREGEGRSTCLTPRFEGREREGRGRGVGGRERGEKGKEGRKGKGGERDLAPLEKNPGAATAFYLLFVFRAFCRIQIQV